MYRVNWLRAKARRDRWNEEVVLLRYEMDWCRNFFKGKLNEWKGLADASILPGHRCYALSRSEMWELLDSHATTVFSSLPNFES